MCQIYAPICHEHNISRFLVWLLRFWWMIVRGIFDNQEKIIDGIELVMFQFIPFLKCMQHYQLVACEESAFLVSCVFLMPSLNLWKEGERVLHWALGQVYLLYKLLLNCEFIYLWLQTWKRWDPEQIDMNDI